MKRPHPSSPLRSRRVLAGSIAAALCAFLGQASSVAAPLYWDTNGNVAGSGDPTGTWGTDLFWTSSAAGTTATGGYVSGSDVIFSAGTTGLTGTVTVGATQIANSITFDDNVVFTLTGGTGLTLGGTTGQGIFVAAGDNVPNTINTPITLDPLAVLPVQNAGTGLLTLTNLTGAATTGVQTVTFSAPNTGGLTVAGIIGNGVGGGAIAVTVNSTGSGVTSLTGRIPLPAG